MLSKLCTRCRAEKPHSAFSAHRSAADGLQAQCKACAAERARLRRVGRPCATCAAPLPAQAKPWARVCDTCATVCTACKTAPRVGGQRLCVACRATSDAARKSPEDAKWLARVSRVRSKYRVRPALAAALSAVYTCEACGKESARAGDLHVDHCHSTEKVRGVLCFNCNAALGHVQDDVGRLLKLVAYLRDKERFKHELDLEKARHYLDLLIELEGRGKSPG